MMNAFINQDIAKQDFKELEDALGDSGIKIGINLSEGNKGARGYKNEANYGNLTDRDISLQGFMAREGVKNLTPNPSTSILKQELMDGTFKMNGEVKFVDDGSVHLQSLPAGFDVDELSIICGDDAVLLKQYSKEENLKANSAGTSPSGLVQDITTSTFVGQKVIRQRYYTVRDLFGWIVPKTANEGGWFNNHIRRVLGINFDVDGGSYEIDATQSQTRHKNVNMQASALQFNTEIRTMAMNISITEQNIAATQRIDILKEKMQSMMQGYALMEQNQVFLGTKSGSLNGLLTNPNVNINTTVLTSPISQMSYAELITFLTTVMATYSANCDNTIMFNRFMLSYSDFQSLTGFISSSFPLLTYEDVLKKLADLVYKSAQVVGVEGMLDTSKDLLDLFVPVKYCDADCNGLGVNRYMLYVYEKQPREGEYPSLDYVKPVDNMLLGLRTVDGFTSTQIMVDQTAGVIINRPQEALYLDYA